MYCFFTALQPQSVEELCICFNLACKYSCLTLQETCLEYAAKHSSSLLNSEGFYKLTPKAMSLILSRDVIIVSSEHILIDNILHWADNRLSSLDIPYGTLRSELENHKILKHLRILSLGEVEFSSFLTRYGNEIFREDELIKLENDYYSETENKLVSKIRTKRILEKRIALCAYNYLDVKSVNTVIGIPVKIFEAEGGMRPVIKSLILPSQTNPVNITNCNVPLCTHYQEHMCVEVTVEDTVIATGVFNKRIKYNNDIHIQLDIIDYTPVYSSEKLDIAGDKIYEANIKILFKTPGHYPITADTNFTTEKPIIIQNSGLRFIHELVMSYEL